MVLFHFVREHVARLWRRNQKRKRGRGRPTITGRQSGSYGAIELHPTASELPVNLVEYFVDAEAAS